MLNVPIKVVNMFRHTGRLTAASTLLLSWLWEIVSESIIILSSIIWIFFIDSIQVRFEEDGEERWLRDHQVWNLVWNSILYNCDVLSNCEENENKKSFLPMLISDYYFFFTWNLHPPWTWFSVVILVTCDYNELSFRLKVPEKRVYTLFKCYFFYYITVLLTLCVN
jgi:hypothetical protein